MLGDRPTSVALIAPLVQAHGDRLAEGAQRKGYEILGNRNRENGAGIVSVRKPGIDGRMIVHDLKERGILAAPRQGWVRMSPHFYTRDEELDRAIAAAEEILHERPVAS